MKGEDERPLCSSHSISTAAAAAKSLQSCPTLWDPTDGSPPGSSVPAILQARILEWAAISFSNAYIVTSVLSDSVRPHGQQPTRLLCPRASPGENTGVACHFLLQNSVYIFNISAVLVQESQSIQFSPSVVSDFLRPHELQHNRPPCPSLTPRVHLNPCPLSR